MAKGFGYLAGMCLLLAGCATTSTSAPGAGTPAEGNASWHQADPAGTEHYKVSHEQLASGSFPLKRIAPVYPAAELPTCPAPIDIQALLIVDKTGRISEVRVDGEAQAGEHRQRYIDAVKAAARQWQFQPLEIDQWVKGADGTKHLAGEAQPFSQTYVFHFECHDGRPSTRIGDAPAT
ncbi:hypothetical protein [Dyella mobilis]|uniref:Lipoprotein n=1 Tax=Dyella mobilis TaxID=1849582 RepID=A0ABS2KAI3_9GAMM|nr:hypothetical protein [Dyella mobilis]MBM7128193.1 hypothetical protein [Dyella mobilis]GLR00011.1 hypothetical protein GCM10007863_44300 [Dyella mobilis]